MPDVPRTSTYQSAARFLRAGHQPLPGRLPESPLNDKVTMRNKIYYRELDWQTLGTLFAAFDLPTMFGGGTQVSAVADPAGQRPGHPTATSSRSSSRSASASSTASSPVSNCPSTRTTSTWASPRPVTAPTRAACPGSTCSTRSRPPAHRLVNRFPFQVGDARSRRRALRHRPDRVLRPLPAARSARATTTSIPRSGLQRARPMTFVAGVHPQRQ